MKSHDFPEEFCVVLWLCNSFLIIKYFKFILKDIDEINDWRKSFLFKNKNRTQLAQGLMLACTSKHWHINYVLICWTWRRDRVEKGLWLWRSLQFTYRQKLTNLVFIKLHNTWSGLFLILVMSGDIKNMMHVGSAKKIGSKRDRKKLTYLNMPLKKHQLYFLKSV